MNRKRLTAALVGGLLLAGAGAEAQIVNNPPFFNAGATAFEPIPASIPSGVTLPAAVNVSADRKYVTIRATPTNQTLLSLTPFTFAGGAGGFVGAGTPVQVNPPPGNPGKPGKVGAKAPLPPATFLDKPGMTLIAPAQP